MDGWFLWLAVQVVRQHMNLIHTSGIWTSHHSEMTVLTDASIIMIIRCFLVTPKMTCKIGSEDTTYIRFFSAQDLYRHLLWSIHVPCLIPSKTCQTDLKKLAWKYWDPTNPFKTCWLSYGSVILLYFSYNCVIGSKIGHWNF